MVIDTFNSTAVSIKTPVFENSGSNLVVIGGFQSILYIKILGILQSRRQACETLDF